MLFKKFGQLRPGYTEMRRFERFPNFFAARKSSGIVAPGLMEDEVLKRVRSRVFVGFTYEKRP